MKPNEPSRTALVIARQRAAHQVLDHGSILYDPFAMKILREDEKEVLQFANGHPLASIGRLCTTARSRIAEDALSRAVERGVRQIVILGAGLDTFALRNPHGARQIRIYEVDHPATQAWKRQRLAQAQIALPPWLILVPVDFEREDVGEKLVAAGFQQNSAAPFKGSRPDRLAFMLSTPSTSQAGSIVIAALNGWSPDRKLDFNKPAIDSCRFSMSGKSLVPYRQRRASLPGGARPEGHGHLLRCPKLYPIATEA